MAFDPLAGAPASTDLDSDTIHAMARQAAERLLVDLDRASRLTDAWQQEQLGQFLVDDALSQCLNRLAQTGCWGQANQLPSSVFWKTAGPVLEVGWLQHRARTKPLGYAGDHEIQARMWEQACCDHPLGRLFDHYFLALAAPQAVRARMLHVAATLAAERLARSGAPYRVVSVGSGPGLDIQAGLFALPECERSGVEVTLLDLDPEALEHASRRIAPLLPEGGLFSRRENLYRLAAKKSLAADLAGADLIVCTGLFDYLADEGAAGMLRFFWQSLGPGGQMLVGNFAPHNPTRAYMEWIGNWYLIYRTAEGFSDLAAAAGIPQDRFAVRTDRTGADLFLVAEKN
jgi:hypothetical protein